MKLLTVVSAIVVLSSLVQAIPHPGVPDTKIQRKRFTLPWSSGSSGSDSGRHHHHHRNDDDDEEDNDDDWFLGPSKSHSHSYHIIKTGILYSSVSETRTKSHFDTYVTPVVDPTPTPLLTITRSGYMNASFVSSASASPSVFPSAALCPSNSVSLITITESCTSILWITVPGSSSATQTTPQSPPSLLISLSTGGVSSGYSSSGHSNSTGIWTYTSSSMPSSAASSTITSAFVNSTITTTARSMPGVSMSTPCSDHGKSTKGIYNSSSSSSSFTSGIISTSPIQIPVSMSTSMVFDSSSTSPSAVSTSSTSSQVLSSSSGLMASESSGSSSTWQKEKPTITILFTTTIPYPTSVLGSSTLVVSALPVSTGVTDLHPTTTILFTTTITTAISSGTPNPAAVHCGLHGLPVGDFFLAEFVENKAGVDVTLKGCWEFCRGVYGIDAGCESYSFYPEPGTGAPRCDLYGGSVAQSLDSIIPQVPNVWFDLACGDPTL
ncbi:hypothetical protein ACMFMG_000727 [Clarireedia jacksonii]